MMKKSKFIFSLLLLILTVSFVYSFDFGFTQNSRIEGGGFFGEIRFQDEAVFVYYES